MRIKKTHLKAYFLFHKTPLSISLMRLPEGDQMYEQGEKNTSSDSVQPSNPHVDTNVFCTERCQLALGASHVGISSGEKDPRWHDDSKPPRRQTHLHLLISEASSVAEMKWITREHIYSAWRLTHQSGFTKRYQQILHRIFLMYSCLGLSINHIHSSILNKLLMILML